MSLQSLEQIVRERGQNTLLSKEGEQRAERLLQRAAKQIDCGKSSSRDQRERERERGGKREGSLQSGEGGAVKQLRSADCCSEKEKVKQSRDEQREEQQSR